MRLKDQVAIVTGGGTGIGKAITMAFAREGANVVITSRTQAVIEQVAREVEAMGRRSLAVVADVSDEVQVKNMVARSLEEFGRVDILVNNAGILGRRQTVAEMSLEMWNEILAVNLTGAMLCSREVIKHMLPRERGVIIMVSSRNGKQAIPWRGPYCASKFGMLGLTQTLAQEVGPFNIRVNAICPGSVANELTEKSIHDLMRVTGKSYEEARQWFVASPMNRMVSPEEVAGLAVFLASDDSSGITGQAIDVTAGRGLG